MKRDYNIRKKDGTIATRLVCTILFLVFTFAWLYWFQADMLAVAQHGLSGGKTHYDRTIGAVISTAVLFLLHLVVFAIVRLSRRTHALTYLPSFLLLAFVSSVSFPFVWGAWLWAGPLVLVLWVVAVCVAKKAYPFENDSREPTGFFSQRMWVNLLQMAAMMLGVVAVSDTNAVNHFKAHAEIALCDGDADEALRVGKRSLETDESLTMLRILALSQKGELAEQLFEYPVAGTSSDMLPLLGSKGKLQLLADTVVWDYFGVRPDSIVAQADSIGLARIYGGKMTTGQYLDSLERRDSVVSPVYRDYRLMGYLIDRQLDTFVKCLPSYFALVADSLPRHYREALVLYQQRINTLYIYNDSTMLSRWHDYLHFDSIYLRKTERKIRAEEAFRGTYWYYFYQ